MPPPPGRFPRPLTILMAALALSGFALSFTHSVAVLKVYGVIYVLAFVAWIIVINRTGSR